MRSELSGPVRAGGRQVVRALGMASAAMRPAPDFLIIGTKRGGTTSLYRYLEQHPAVLPLFPSARRLPLRENMKGVHYFDTSFHKGDRWYRSHFPTARARRGARRAYGRAVVGEASPYYLFHPLAAERAAAAVPLARIVVVLRDPVERAASHWAEQTRDGKETLSFTEALQAETSRVGIDGARLATGELARSYAHEHQTYAAQGEYVDALVRWTARFPRDRVLVLFSEDLYRDPQSTLDRTLAFLGVAPHRLGSAVAHNPAPRPAIDPSVRTGLEARFRPGARRLAGVVGAHPPWGWLVQ